MKLYVVNTFVDSRPVLNEEKIEAGQWHTAFNRAAYLTKKRYTKGRRISTMAVMIALAGEIKKEPTV